MPFSNPNNLKMVVANGHLDDVGFVLQQIECFMAVSVSGWFEFCFHLPPWHESALSRLRTWLESAGFEETHAGKFIFLDPHQPVRLPTVALSVLFSYRIL
jgi:hypothetical protein